MNFRGLWPWLAILALVLGVTARECNESSYYKIDSPQNITAYFDGCTTITAQKIYITNNYNGPVLLPGVVNITGKLYSDYNLGYKGRWPVIPSFEAPDLRSLGGLSLNGVHDLVNVSFPALESLTGAIEIDSPGAGLNLSFPTLREAGSLTVLSDVEFASLDFTSLETVTNDLFVEYCLYCLPEYAERRIEFPSLVSAGYLYLRGSATWINLPKLTTVGPPAFGNSDSTGSGLKFEIGDRQTLDNLQLPSLTSVDNQMDIRGAVSLLNIPQLKSTSATIHIESTSELNLHMQIESAATIDISGDIERVSLPSLTTADDLTINAPDLPCELIQHNLQDDVAAHITCYASPALSSRAKAGIGVGAAAGVVILVVLGCFGCKRRIRRERRKAAANGELVDMPAGAVWNVPLSNRPLVPRARSEPPPQPRPRTPPPPYTPNPT